MTTTLIFFAALLVGQTVVAVAAAPRPNIIVVLADDMGFSGLEGCRTRSNSGDWGEFRWQGKPVEDGMRTAHDDGGTRVCGRPRRS